MQTLSQLFIDIKRKKPSVKESEEPSYSMVGGCTGFVFFWLAFFLPFVIYGSNTLFFLLYTWPVFLALMPISVLIGIAFSMLFSGRLWKTLPLTGLVVFCVFWTVFKFLSGW
jgi:hypothetical protein